MSDFVGDLDFALQIEALDFGPLLLLATRIEKSKTPEQLIYRELEIDQVWRLLEAGAPVEGLATPVTARLRAQIEKVHDLIGVDGDAQRAADTLRSALSSAS